MATLFDILEEIQYGKDFIKSKKKYGEIGEHYNTEFGYYDYGKRLKSLSEALGLKGSSLANFEKILEDIQDVENRYLNEGRVTATYRKIKGDSLFLNIKKLKESVENVSLFESRKYDFDKLGKLFSTSYAAYKDVLKTTDYEPKTLAESKFEKLQNVLNEDLKALENFLED